MADIFISYKKERRAHAERLAAVLEAYGYEVWWDYELAVGPDFRDQIQAKLELSQLVIVLWCSGAVKSKFVRSEANRADKRQKLIQCYLEWVEPPLGFEEAQGQPLVNWIGEAEGDTLAGLLGALKTKLGERRRAENVIRLINMLPPLPKLEPMVINDPEEAEEPLVRTSTSATAVESGASPSAVPPSAARWTLIAKSLDPADYDDFLGVFPQAPEAFDARRHKRQLENWAAVNHASASEIVAFMKDPTKGANLFAALDEHATKSMRRASDAELKARQEREAAELVKAEAKARERKELEERFGPEAALAAPAAMNGKPVAERLYPLRLEGVSGWPAPLMVVIPPGRFLMGTAEGDEGTSRDEYPQREVRVNYPFAFGEQAVTFAEWDAALASGARLERPADAGWGRDKRPVINVSWHDAQAYLAWLNDRLGLDGRSDAYRLPSEAEWEYACRAGSMTPYSTGETISTLEARFRVDNDVGATVPVGSYAANAFGLYDMHGNVWEWCTDAWHKNYQSAPTDGSHWESGDISRRVLRGGSWYNSPRDLRSAKREWDVPTIRNRVFGFRLARTLSVPAD